MNETLKKTISDIMSEAQNIAEDSTAMRRPLFSIVGALEPTIKTAGISFGSTETSQLWESGNKTCRIGIYHAVRQWRIGIEATLVPQEVWDRSKRAGRTDPFGKSTHVYAVQRISFKDASRESIEHVIVRLPCFLVAYCEELKRRHILYADLRKIATDMKDVVTEARVHKEAYQ